MVLFLRLDSFVLGGGVFYDYDMIIVEYVLLQNFLEKSKWLEWFLEVVLCFGVVYIFGNFVFFMRKKNSFVSNYDFDKKKIVYFV